MKKNELFYIDGEHLVEQAKPCSPKPSKNGYKVILVGRDFFFKGTTIKEFSPRIYIPKFEPVSLFLGENIVAEPGMRMFEYIGMWGKFLIYKEI